MIDKHLTAAATVITETAEMARPETLADLVPLFAVGLVLAQHQMVRYLLDVEPDWPWNQ